MSPQTEYVKLDPSIANAMPRLPAKPSGALDSALHTPNGGIMTVNITSCPDITPGEKAKVMVEIIELDREFIRNNEVVSEGSDDDLLATFEGYLENRAGKFIFSEMQPLAEPGYLDMAFCPWFNLAFAGEGYKVTNSAKASLDGATFPVLAGVLEGKEENEGDEFEIGFVIKKDGTVICSSGRTASLFDGEYSTALLLECFGIRTEIEDQFLDESTNDLGRFDENNFADKNDQAVCEASTTRVYSSTSSALKDEKLKAVEDALEKIDKLIKTSKNPYFQNIKAVNKYYETLGRYKNLLARSNGIKKNDTYTWQDTDTMARAVVMPIAQELNKLEEQITTYLSSSKHTPYVYSKQIKEYSDIIRRNKKIGEALDNPIVKVLGLLPGAGVVTGSLKLLQGNTLDGFLDIFGSVVTYGSFIKLARVARAYTRASKSTVELLYSYRYRNLVSQITSADVMKNITSTSLSKSNSFLGNLFSTIGSFKALSGSIDDIALLHKHRKVILEITNKTIVGMNGGLVNKTDQYLDFLKQLGNANEVMEYFACLRLAYRSVKAGKDAHTAVQSALEEVKQLLGHTDVPGVAEFNPAVITKSEDMFLLMDDRGIEIEKVLLATTQQFQTDRAIVEYFNAQNVQSDEFGVTVGADIRYKNTRSEMLLALDEVIASWKEAEKERDAYVKEKSKNYVNEPTRYLYTAWAKEYSQRLVVGVSLSEKVDNFVNKIQGVIASVEGVEPELVYLSSLAGQVINVNVGNLMVPVSINVAAFNRVAREMINNYF